MSDIKDTLNRLRAAGGLMSGADLLKQRAHLDEERRAGVFEIDRCVPGELVGEGESRFYLVRREFPLDTSHGGIELGAALDAIPEHIALTACDPLLDSFEPATAAFIDVETTGLSGGTGTVAFLVGIGYFVENMFRLDQCFMRDFDDEEAMLACLDSLFARVQTVVTFNGKSFDIPLLRTRFISNRLPFRLDAVSHFDLVHAVRRIWKLRLKDCSLGNIEREVLGIRRQGDVPSAEIPQIWLDYLRTRDARKLKAVFHHHEMDILSLVALTALLSRCIETPAGEGFSHAEDRLSLLHLHFRQRRFEQAVEHANRLLESEVDPSIRRQTIEFLAFACKRMGDWPRMQETWELMVQEFPKDLLARLELAKHHEHRTRNLPEARRLCEDALQYLETRAALGHEEDVDAPHARQFQRRLDRIRRKLARRFGRDKPSGEEDETESFDAEE